MSSEEKMPITKEFELARSSCAFVVKLVYPLISLFNSQKNFKKALAKIKKCDILNSWIVTGHAGKT